MKKNSETVIICFNIVLSFAEHLDTLQLRNILLKPVYNKITSKNFFSLSQESLNK